MHIAIQHRPCMKMFGAAFVAAENTQGQLFQTTWENPLPDVAVDSIDYVATMKEGTPFLVGITVEP